MNSFNIGHKVARAVTAIVAGFGIVVSTNFVPDASAQTGGNIVVFGDSFTSSPEESFNFARGSSLSSTAIPADYPRTGGCLQDPQNWPREMQRRTGIRVHDWSCTAETSTTFLGRIDGARKAGHLNSGTRAVFMSVGGNDFGPWGISQGKNPFDINSQRASYSANIARAKAKIRAVAPQAEIIIAGYPEVSTGTTLCLFNVAPGSTVGVPFAGDAIENDIRSMQRYGAARNGLKFVDNYALTRGHNTCARNGAERYVNGWLDTTSTRATMPLHPTAAGHRALAINNLRAIGL